MAGIQIPSIKRFAPQGPASVGRVEANVPDSSRAIAQTGKAVEGILNEELEHQNRLEDEAADLVATSAASEYEIKFEKGLAQARVIKGDPTEHYSKLDTDSVAWTDEILTKHESASPRTQKMIREKMSRRDVALREKRNVNQAVQFAAYDNETTQDAVKLRQAGLLTAAETADAKDPKSFLRMEAEIDEIRRLNGAWGQRNGFVSRDANGKESHAPSLQERMKKDISDGLHNVIATLNASGKPDEAAYLLSKYKGDLLPKDRLSLLKGHKEAKDDNQALVLAESVRGLPQDVAMKKLDQFGKANDPESLKIRRKAKQFVDDDHRRNEKSTERASKGTFEEFHQEIETGKYVSWGEFKNSKDFKAVKDKMLAKHVDALEQSFNPPKESDPEAVQTMIELMDSGAFVGMSAPDLASNFSGLSAADRKKFSSIHLEDNRETGAENRTKMTSMAKFMEEELVRTGVIAKNSYGKYSNKDRITYISARNAIMRDAPDLKKANQQTVNAYVQKYVSQRVKDRVFTDRPVEKLQPKIDEKKKTKVDAGSSGQATMEQKVKAVAEYQRIHGKPWKSANDPGQVELRRIIKSMEGKK